MATAEMSAGAAAAARVPVALTGLVMCAPESVFATSAALLILIHVAARALHPAVRRLATTHVPLVAARRVAMILVIATTTAEMTAKATAAARFPPALTPF